MNIYIRNPLYYSFDHNAKEYIELSGITGNAQREGLNKLVLMLKGQGTTNSTDIWVDSLCIHPYCPIDATTATLDGFKLNLVDPQDTDAAHRLEYYNSPTPSMTGLTGNGTNAYADTNFIPSTDATEDDFSFTQSSLGVSTDSYTFGGRSTLTKYQNFRRTGGNIDTYNGSVANRATVTAFDTVPWIATSNRTADNNLDAYNFGVLNNTDSGTSNSLSSQSLYILCSNNNGSAIGFTSSTTDFNCMNNSLSANGIADLSEAIQAYNTAVR